MTYYDLFVGHKFPPEARYGAKIPTFKEQIPIWGTGFLPTTRTGPTFKRTGHLFSVYYALSMYYPLIIQYTVSIYD